MGGPDPSQLSVTPGLYPGPPHNFPCREIISYVLVCGGHLSGKLAPEVEIALGTLTSQQATLTVGLGLYGDYTFSESGEEPADLVGAALAVVGPRGTVSDAGLAHCCVRQGVCDPLVCTDPHHAGYIRRDTPDRVPDRVSECPRTTPSGCPAPSAHSPLLSVGVLADAIHTPAGVAT